LEIEYQKESLEFPFEAHLEIEEFLTEKSQKKRGV